MKSIKKILAGVVCILSAQISCATQSNFYGVTVTGINIAAGANNVLFVKVNSSVGTGGCHTDPNWNFAISLDPVSNPTGKYMFALLLAAQTNGSPVDIIGMNTCPAYSTIQGISRISNSN